MKLKCLICGKRFNHLGSHIWHRHKITAREYKEEFGLPYKMALISTEVKLKKQDAFEKDREKYLANIINNKKWQFKKGKSGIRRISQREREVTLERILKYNKKRKTKKIQPIWCSLPRTLSRCRFYCRTKKNGSRGKRVKGLYL